MKQNSSLRPSLFLCLLLDSMSCLSYFMPVYNVLFKLLWAPVASFIYFRMYGGRLGFFGGVLVYIEESTSYSLMVPMFTITYFARSRSISRQSATRVQY